MVVREKCTAVIVGIIQIVRVTAVGHRVSINSCGIGSINTVIIKLVSCYSDTL